MVGPSWYLQWFRALDHQNQCKDQEKPPKLYFERELENCVSSGFSRFLQWFGGFSWLVFLGFYSGFELLTTRVAVRTKKNQQKSILRYRLKMVFSLVSRGFYSGLGVFSWLLVVFLLFYSRFGG